MRSDTLEHHSRFTETAVVAQTASQLQTGTGTSSGVSASLSNPTILYISVSMGLARACPPLVRADPSQSSRPHGHVDHRESLADFSGLLQNHRTSFRLFQELH